MNCKACREKWLWPVYCIISVFALKNQREQYHNSNNSNINVNVPFCQVFKELKYKLYQFQGMHPSP